MDGSDFHVDVDKVEEAASGIRRSVDDQDRYALRGLCGDAGLYGHGGIHDALMNFCARWSDGLDTLTDDAAAIGDVLDAAAKAYRSADEAAASTLEGDPGQRAVGDG